MRSRPCRHPLAPGQLKGQSGEIAGLLSEESGIFGKNLSGGSAWEDLKSGIELVWTAMGEAIDSAKSRFK
jgi:hypothetical protein